MKKIILSLSLLLVFLLYSCKKTNDVEESINQELITKNAQEIAQHNNKLGFDFFREIINTEMADNLMISPVSLSLALGMVYNGSDGETKAAFDKVLDYKQSLPEVNLFNQ